MRQERVLSQQQHFLHSTMVRTRTEYLAPEKGRTVGLVMEVIEMDGVYMIWVGIAGSKEEAGRATAAGRLTGDWAYGLGRGGTRLYGGDYALGLAQRLGEVIV